MADLKDKDVIAWKGVKWNKLFKPDGFYTFTQVGIQFATLGRYTHTAIYRTYKDKEFLIQSGSKNGMHILDITGQTWFRSNIDENVYDQFRKNKIVENEFSKMVDSKMKELYKSGEKMISFGKYNFPGILNQISLNFAGKSFQKKTNESKMFCSEMTTYYFTKDPESFRISPTDLANSDEYSRIK